jgi:hypothetical protein
MGREIASGIPSRKESDATASASSIAVLPLPLLPINRGFQTFIFPRAFKLSGTHLPGLSGLSWIRDECGGVWIPVRVCVGRVLPAGV